MRGEKCPRACGRLARIGSPPHARGKVINLVVVVVDLGITPACAGKRSKATLLCFCIQDHPRMRGEKRLALVQAGHIVGITPACAGKSFWVMAFAVTSRDHPRMRGEKQNGDAGPGGA